MRPANKSATFFSLLGSFFDPVVEENVEKAETLVLAGFN